MIDEADYLLQVEEATRFMSTVLTSDPVLVCDPRHDWLRRRLAIDLLTIVQITYVPTGDTEYLKALRTIADRKIVGRTGRLTPHTDHATALFAANPLLKSITHLREKYFPEIPEETAFSVRGRLRTKATNGAWLHTAKPSIDPATGRLRRAGREGRPVAEPMHPEKGFFYSELYPLDQAAMTRAAVTHLDHCASPFYLFHAWAWGRRIYADWLDEHGYDVCPYTGLTSLHLRHNNPNDGSGIAWIALAYQMIEDRHQAKLPYLKLWIPARGECAHKIPDSPFYSPRSLGSSLVTIKAHLLQIAQEAGARVPVGMDRPDRRQRQWR